MQPRIAWFPALSALGLSLLLYSVNLRGGYLYDDLFLIRQDRRATDPGEWTLYFHERYQPYAADPLWRPLVSLSFVLHNRLHGETAWPAHAVNMLLHGLAAAAVAELARRISHRPAAGWLAGLLFAAHPVHVEAVSMIVGRAEIMATLGILFALLLYHRPLLKPRHILGIGLCFIFALLSKEHGILLGPILLAWEIARRRCGNERVPWLSRNGPHPGRLPEGESALALEGGVTKDRHNGLQWLFVTICAITVGYVLYRESWGRLVYDKAHLVWTVNPMKLSRGADLLLVPFSILGRYTQLLFFPHALSPDYGADVFAPHVRWHEPWVYLGFATTAAWTVSLAWAWRKRAFVPLVCLLSAAAAYALISNLFYLIGTIMGERLIYLTSVFFIIIVADLLARLPRNACVAVAAVILVMFSIRTTTYAWRWNDPARLWTLSRIDQPRSAMLCYLSIDEDLNRGHLKEAEQTAAAARRLVPGAWKAWALSAKVAHRLGKADEVQEYVRRAMAIDPYPPQLDP